MNISQQILDLKDEIVKTRRFSTLTQKLVGLPFLPQL